MSARYVYRVMDFWRSSQDHFKEVAETLERITAERDAFRDERNEAREALQAVRELHYECTTGNCACGGGPGWCHGCDEGYPCSTVRALDAALGGAE